jgi:hypothetical protein
LEYRLPPVVSVLNRSATGGCSTESILEAVTSDGTDLFLAGCRAVPGIERTALENPSLIQNSLSANDLRWGDVAAKSQ